MKIFPVIVRRIVSGSGNGFVASVIQAGISLSNQFELLGGTVLPAITAVAERFGVTINQTPGFATSLNGATGTAMESVNAGIDVDASLRDLSPDSFQQNPAFVADQSLRSVAPTSFQQSPAFATSLNGATGTAASPAQNPAIACSAVITDAKMPEVPAFDIQQVTYSLTRRVGSNAAANLGPQNWTNPNNANGIHDGTNATSAGNVLSAQDYNIELNYANSVLKGELTISAATLFVYASVTGDTTGLLSTFTISYDIGAGYVVLETIAGNFNSLTTPRSYDLSAVLNTWTKYDALKVKIRHQTSAVAVGISGAVDASEIEVVASKTDSL